ncbi:uncharacterized protein BDZ99DRAFT_486093 [Mytilinidion resinicola]|uniref:PH domain-containing protein n=1 Tax=Mytilinidion resinicola TaxID=574789 RepID=A0A6A6Z000_9PEZI|nr:uncharacterized protein BDZ99DRAFT_486093 [Mytilinidion resinicola]KAF2814059.1 hypothetical protein BDZ99DRAFT_486093 [Mytilinidion resinicola]
MAQRPLTPSQGLYDSVPPPNDPAHLHRGYGTAATNASHLDIDQHDFGTTPGNPGVSSPLSQSLAPQRSKFGEDFDATQRGTSVLNDGDLPHRTASNASTLNQGAAPARSGTLKKKGSVRRTGSLKRSGSKRSLHAGSIRGVNIEDEGPAASKENSVFYTPVPTTGNPTEVLASRFQAWRKLLKDIIAYFREVQTSYEHRSKTLLKVSNVINNTNAPSAFLTEGGLNEANRILRDFHKQTVVEANKARDIEIDVIGQLNGLRQDLAQKIKEIKSLSGDFKNSVEKEKESTRKAVASLEESLNLIDTDPSSVAGKGDPYVVRLGVDRQIERQIDEENYLHRAYLNLENSGRELESIVVGEIQKSYNALATILKRDADEEYATVDKLRNGPIAMPKDFEWNHYVENDPHFVNPRIPLRRLEDIQYPGKNHPATTEVRAGMLERKSKYLKSYTPGWYVLSPTHLHEFKSADRIYTQPPVMSLYLPDQKLGSHSQPGGSSHKFVLKGRQTGSMHRGHSWVFRAESYDTMMAWYEDIKSLTEKTGEERNAFVRRHARSVSQGSHRSVSSDGGLDEDEADAVPYSANQSVMNEPATEELQQRPSPGGRFPSDIQVNRHLQAPLSPSSGSSDIDHDLTTAAGGLQASYPETREAPVSNDLSQSQQIPQQSQQIPQQPQQLPQQHAPYPPYEDQYGNPVAGGLNTYQQPNSQQTNSYYQAPYPNSSNPPPAAYQPQSPQIYSQPQSSVPQSQPAVQRHESSYGDWMAPAAGGVAAGALGAETYHHHQHDGQNEQEPAVAPVAEETAPVSHLQATPTEALSHPAPALPLMSAPSAPVSLTSTISTVPTSLSTSTAEAPFLGGAEAATGAASASTIKATGASGEAFPGILRNNTGLSVSDLHVPGEYPKGPGVAS